MDSIISIVQDNGALLLIGQYPSGPLGGITVTFLLSISGILLAFPFGVLLALARVSPYGWLRSLAAIHVYLVRGVPLIMLIFWVYFFVPRLIGHTVSGYATMLVTLVVYQAAYLAEIVRAGIEGLNPGQMEAARAVGLTYMQATRKIILPQAIYNMVPALISQFSSCVKDTSLGYVISVNELTFAANQINGNLLTKPFQVFLTLAILYFAFCFSLTCLARRLERRASNRRSGTSGSSAAVPLSTAVLAVE